MTPQEIRAAALQAAVTRAATLSQVPTTSGIKQLADVFAEYITGQESVPLKEVRHPLPQRRVVPIPEQRDEPTEHIDHDGELWGALCAECSHSQGVHKFGGCHFPIEGSDGHTFWYCACEAFTDVRPATRKKIVIVPKCGLCGKDWSDVHGQPGDPCTGGAL